MSNDSGLKHRGPKKRPSHQDLNGGNSATSTPSKVVVKAKQEIKSQVGSQWDYKVALVVVTLLGFATRFYGITHPNSVVFDEVHFGKVS
jgi:dolichyl-phosphate-mannose-protein mannosyltransferase